jgi:uncharacterized phage infection (PIP) family protein YhgE
MEAAAAAMNAQFAIESRRLRMKLEEAQRDTAALTALRDALKEETAALEKQLEDTDRLSQAEHRQNMGNMSTIVIQQDAVMGQLREQLKNARQGQVTKVSLAVIESEHKDRMAKLRAQFAKKETNLQLRMQQLDTRYGTELTREQTRTQEILDNLHDQIAQVQADIGKAKEDLEAVATNGRARLEEVQKEAQAAEQIIMVSQRPRMSSPSYHIAMSRSNLPPLKNNG